MMLWPVDEVFTADTTDLPPRPAAATVSSAVASASSAIATASSAIATASSAIATASSAIATASSAIATDPSATAVDAIACDDDTADLCDTTTVAAAASAVTSGVTSAIAGDDDDCTTVTAAPTLGLHGAGATGRGLDIVGPSRRSDGLFDRVVVRPRTVGLEMIEKIVLIALSMFFEKLEMAVYMSLYKLKLLYSTLIAPVLDI
ncbi:hypothetical protein ACI65C_006262 [Semiaphis heraclei]